MKKTRILLIDDEPQLTKLLALQLERHGGYTVVVENDPRNALAKARSFGPDIVLCDVDMPYCDGGSVATELQSELPAPVPLVFLTSLVCQNEVGGGSRTLGGFPFLAKPIKINEVVACITRVLGGMRGATLCRA